MPTLNISTDFSMYPGARYYSDGPDSGQMFYDDKLKAAFQNCLDAKEKLVVNLDGTAGYASSFLSESFGRLAEEFGVKVVLQNVEIISNDEPDWKDAILKDYIPNASKRMKRALAHA